MYTIGPLVDEKCGLWYTGIKSNSGIESTSHQQCYYQKLIVSFVLFFKGRIVQNKQTIGMITLLDASINISNFRQILNIIQIIMFSVISIILHIFFFKFSHSRNIGVLWCCISKKCRYFWIIWKALCLKLVVTGMFWLFYSETRG